MAQVASSLAVSLVGVELGVDLSGVNDPVTPSSVEQFVARALGAAAAVAAVTSGGPPPSTVQFTASSIGTAAVAVTVASSSTTDAPPTGFSYLVDSAGNYLVDSTGTYLIGIDR